MRERFKAEIEHGQVVDWTERDVSPLGRVHRFEASPSPELAYLCGVKVGDATQSKGTWQHSYKFRLLTIDREFAAEFSRCAGVVLKCRPFKVWWYAKRNMWCTEVSSILLYKFLKEGLPGFKECVSHCPKCAAAFLRGFFDSEAGVSESELTVSNGNLDVLRYAQRLLRMYFGIDTTGPYPQGPPPGTRRLIKGRLCTVNLQNHIVRIRNDSVNRFARNVGFSILRKSSSLERLLAKIHRHA